MSSKQNTDYRAFEEELAHFLPSNPGNPSRTMFTFLRSRYHFFTHAIAIADRKANIMVRLNSMIISGLIVFFKLYGSFTKVEVIILAVLLITTITSLTFATIAAQPTSKAKMNRTDRDEDAASHLFNFRRTEDFPFEEYRDGFDQIMNDNQLIYGNMARDLYQLSGNTTYKYRQLRVAYKSFRMGLIVVVALFVVTLIDHGYGF